MKHLVSKEGCDVNETGTESALPHAAAPIEMITRSRPAVRNQGEQTALRTSVLAAELDNVECVQLLLTHGASVGMQDGQMRRQCRIASSTKVTCEHGAGHPLRKEPSNGAWHSKL